MFDIGWGELVIIGIVALIAIGPKELPGVLRAVGQWMGKIRRMASEFQGQFQDAMREAEMADLKKQADDLGSAVSNITNFDPMGDVKKDIERSLDSVKEAAEKPVDAPAADAPKTEPAAEQIPVSPPDVPAPDFAPVEPNPKKQAGGGA